MNKKTWLTGGIVVLTVVFAFAVLQSYFFSGKKPHVDEKRREEVLDPMTRTPGDEPARAAANKLIKYREIDEKTGRVAWEVECKNLTQLEKEKTFTVTDGRMTIFNYGDGDAVTKLTVVMPFAHIENKIGKLSRGVTLRSEDGVAIQMEEAVVDLGLRQIDGPGSATLTQLDPKTGKPAVEIRGKNLHSDTKLQELTLGKVDAIRLFSAPGSLGGGDVTGKCAGALEASTVSGTAKFHDAVTLESPATSLSADSLVLLSDPRTRQLQEFTASGHVRFSHRFTNPGDPKNAATPDAPWAGACETLRYRADADLKTVDPAFPEGREAVMTFANGSAPVTLTRGEERLSAPSMVVLADRGEVRAKGGCEITAVNPKPADPAMQPGLLRSEKFAARSDELTAAYAQNAQGQWAPGALRMNGNFRLDGSAESMAGDALFWDREKQIVEITGAPAKIKNDRLDLSAKTARLDRAAKTFALKDVANMNVLLDGKPQKNGAPAAPEWWRVTAGELTAGYGGDYSDVTSLNLKTAVTAHSDSYSISADAVDFDATTDDMKLSGAPARAAQVATGEWVEAKSLTLNRARQTVSAKDAVRVLLKRALTLAGGSASATPAQPAEYQIESDAAHVTWDAQKQISDLVLDGHVKGFGGDLGGECARLESKNQGALFKITAEPGKKIRLTSGANTLIASTLEKSEPGVIHATGGVETVTEKPAPTPGAKPDAWRAAADSAVIHVDDATRALKKIIAEGPVTLKNNDVEGRGARLIWIEETQSATLEGAPAVLTRSGDTLTAPVLHYSKRDQTARGDGGVGMTFHRASQTGGADNEWSLSGESFDAVFGDDPARPGASMIVRAVVEGNIKLKSAEFETQGSRFDWDGKTRTGLIKGDPRIRVKRGDGWIEAEAIAYTPERKTGQKNFITFVGPVTGVLPPDDGKK